MSCNGSTAQSVMSLMRMAVASLMLAAASLPARSAEWEPEAPMPDKFDWVQLKSGEWLKGADQGDVRRDRWNSRATNSIC